MPPINENHLSPTGQRIMPSSQADTVSPIAPAPLSRPVTVSASQLNADIVAYLRELEELRRLVMLKIMGEISGD